MENLGMRLKVARVRAGLNQQQLACLIGAKYQFIVSLWENGKFVPSERYMKRLNQFLNLDSKAIRLYKILKNKRGRLTREVK